MMLLYHLVTVHIVWYAPVYGWLLLISAWARRAPILWAALPPFALFVLEKITFGTSHFVAFLQYRLSGPEGFRFTPPGGDPMGMMTGVAPLTFLSTPGLWTGLVVFTVFLVAAARLRRFRGPA